MTLEDAMDEDTIITRVDAKRECQRHSLDAADMFVELGDHSEYKARDVLRWLGY